MIEQREKTSTRPALGKWGCVQREEKSQQSGLHQEEQIDMIRNLCFDMPLNKRGCFRGKNLVCRKS